MGDSQPLVIIAMGASWQEPMPEMTSKLKQSEPGVRLALCRIISHAGSTGQLAEAGEEKAQRIVKDKRISLVILRLTLLLILLTDAGAPLFTLFFMGVGLC